MLLQNTVDVVMSVIRLAREKGSEGGELNLGPCDFSFCFKNSFLCFEN